MTSYDITVDGLPATSNIRKFQLFVESQIGAKTIKNAGRTEDGKVGLVFSDLDGTIFLYVVEKNSFSRIQ